MVHEHIHVRSKSLDVVCKNSRLSCLEHELVDRKRGREGGNDVRAPFFDVLGDAFRLNLRQADTSAIA